MKHLIGDGYLDNRAVCSTSPPNLLSNLERRSQPQAGEGGVKLSNITLSVISCRLIRRLITGFLLSLMLPLAACNTLDAPTLTPTHGLTGPTIAPSPQIFTGPPTEGIPSQAGSIGQSDPTAAALPNQGALPPNALDAPEFGHQLIEVIAQDGSLLSGELYQRAETRQPGILLLGLSAGAWGDFPAQLNAAGFTVLVMALREDGDETDVEVMIDALVSGTADPAHIAAIGAGEGADLVLRGCAVNSACDTVILLSPLDAPELLNALAQFNPRPMMLAASEEDQESFATAQALNDAATGDKLFQPLVSAGHGTALLNNRPDLVDLMIDWLRRQLA